MRTKVDIGIIGAMDKEVESLISSLENHTEELIGSVKFHTGILEGKNVVIARCGIGKVFAALCTEAMILAYSPSLIINTGVGGGLSSNIKVTDIVVAEKLVQHDMDTSAIGDPKGLVSGINIIYFNTDKRAADIVKKAATDLSFTCHTGTIASGDIFVADKDKKQSIRKDFSADVCEMEGAAIAQVAYVNNIPCCVIRAISDSADEGSSMDYLDFLPLAAERSEKITRALCREF